MICCASCGIKSRKTYNVDYCSAACTLVGEITIDVLAHNWAAQGGIDDSLSF